MSKNTAACRVCGKSFVPCGKSSAEIGAFNYREVACSPECGQEYLKRVIAARQPVKDISAEMQNDETIIVSEDTK